MLETNGTNTRLETKVNREEMDTNNGHVTSGVEGSWMNIWHMNSRPGAIKEDVMICRDTGTGRSQRCKLIDHILLMLKNSMDILNKRFNSFVQIIWQW